MEETLSRPVSDEDIGSELQGLDDSQLQGRDLYRISSRAKATDELKGEEEDRI